jgi:DNA-binding transcriptional ArsR family regulator
MLMIDRSGRGAMAASAQTRERAAKGCAEIFDSELFRALCEPVRIEIVRLLIARGRSDLSGIAGELPQDASVISRHLAVLYRAGVVRRARSGRHVYFELDGPELLARLEAITGALRRAAPFCCPGDPGRE